jgi:hypothetical protein
LGEDALESGTMSAMSTIDQEVHNKRAGTSDVTRNSTTIVYSGIPRPVQY